MELPAEIKARSFRKFLIQMRWKFTHLSMLPLECLNQKWLDRFPIWNSNYFVIWFDFQLLNRSATLKIKISFQENFIIEIYEKIIILSLSNLKVFIKIILFLTKNFKNYLSIGRIFQLIFNFEVVTMCTVETGSTRNFAGVDHKLSQNLRVWAKTYSFCGIGRFQ